MVEGEHTGWDREISRVAEELPKRQTGEER
jgi:hypothetical protein